MKTAWSKNGVDFTSWMGWRTSRGDPSSLFFVKGSWGMIQQRKYVKGPAGRIDLFESFVQNPVQKLARLGTGRLDLSLRLHYLIV